MAWVNHTFGERFVGGSEMVTPITHSLREEARDTPVPIDLTGYSIGAEVWWEGYHRLSPAVVIGNLATGYPHYTVTLSEQQTLAVPLGRVAQLRLIRVDPGGVTTIHAPLMLERVA